MTRRPMIQTVFQIFLHRHKSFTYFSKNILCMNLYVICRTSNSLYVTMLVFINFIKPTELKTPAIFKTVLSHQNLIKAIFPRITPKEWLLFHLHRGASKQCPTTHQNNTFVWCYLGGLFGIARQKMKHPLRAESTGRVHSAHEQRLGSTYSTSRNTTFHSFVFSSQYRYATEKTAKCNFHPRKTTN